jgi:hypothetical protein
MTNKVASRPLEVVLSLGVGPIQLWGPHRRSTCVPLHFYPLNNLLDLLLFDTFPMPITYTASLRSNHCAPLAFMGPEDDYVGGFRCSRLSSVRQINTIGQARHLYGNIPHSLHSTERRTDLRWKSTQTPNNSFPQTINDAGHMLPAYP